VISAKIEALLQERMGLDARSIGAVAIERAIRERQAACGLASQQAYWAYIETTESEIQELIETVVVPETWFFRDREAFTALARTVIGEWLPANPGGMLRVLSLPCSTGEEPFSIAMALLDAGLPAERFTIEAVDISLRVVAHAQQAKYGKNSFRGADLGFRERHFEQAGTTYHLAEHVSRQVNFRQANLLATGAFPAAHVYDVIFCRNVLIYFDAHGRKLAIRLLTQLLAPAGMLYVGPSESGLMLDHGFESARMPLAFAFRRPESRPYGFVPPKIPRSLPTIPPAFVPSATAVPARPAAPVSAPTRTMVDTGNWIEAAQRLADEGKLQEAMELCERNLDDQTPSAQAFYLMGLLHDAAGRFEQASEHYRKALYWDPVHQEALVHLGAALLREGDASAAQRLFDRAKRAERGGSE
jgi:chemotaxis protein methyltransferase WspC